MSLAHARSLSEDLKPYQYQALKKPQSFLRILVLLPGHGEDRVTCHLEQKEDPKSDRHGHSETETDKHGYEAMSWCWGDFNQEQFIVILDHHSQPTCFPISQDLHDALVALRSTSEPRYLWIDAICINQPDLKERAQQVARMNEIYGNARNVCIWLGKETPKTKEALKFIKDHVLNVYSFDNLCKDKDYVNSWAAVLELMKRKWFQRRWVVQEVSLAQKASVHCGTDWVNWEDFGAAVSLFVDVDDSARRLSELVKRMEEFGHADDFFKEVPALGATRLVNTTNKLFKKSVGGIPQRTSALEDIVAELAMFETSEPRDTVYALLALAKDSQPSVEKGIPDYLGLRRLTEPQKKALRTMVRLLQPYRQSYNVDYKQHVVDVYQQFIAFAMLRSDATRALDVICRPFAASYTYEQDVSFDKDLLGKLTDEQKGQYVPMPSWIPNVSEVPFVKRNKPRRSNVSHPDDIFVMDRQRGEPFVSTPDTVSYSAAGYKAYNKNKVRFRKRSDHYSMFVEGFALDTVDAVEEASQLGNLPPGWLVRGNRHDEKDSDVFWKTLVADRSPKGHAPLYYKTAIQAALKHAPVASTFDIGTHIREKTSEVVSEVLRQVQATIWERQLVETSRELLGLAPRGTQKGDLVCILYGCSVPVILRRIPKEEEAVQREVKDDEDDRLRRQEKSKAILKKLFDRQKEKRPEVQPEVQPAIRFWPIARRLIWFILFVAAVVHVLRDDLAGNFFILLAAPHLLMDVYRLASTSSSWWNALLDHGVISLLPMLVLAFSLAIPAAKRSFSYSTLLLLCFDAIVPEVIPSAWEQWCSRYRQRILSANPSKSVKDGLSDQLDAPGDRNTVEPDDGLLEKKPPTESTIIKLKIRPDEPPHRNYYELIGECYIHKMMNGEAIQWQNETGLRPETFELR